MSVPSKKQISENRRLLQNPYAYDDGEGRFDAVAGPVEATNEEITANRRLLGNPYAHIGGDGRLSALVPPARQRGDVAPQVGHAGRNNRPGYQWIEEAARKLQATIWRRRQELWPEGVPPDPVELLNPAVALQLIGFDFEMNETLGQLSNENGKFEVAGIVDPPTKRVSISRQLPFNTRQFTAAHELGHALLHKDMRLHRDRPLDGSAQEQGKRNKAEIEADKFASFFLMPKNLVWTRFRQVFLCDRFVLNEATAFALDPSDSWQLLSGNKTQHELARILASTGSYNSRHFRPLSDQFHVSIEAMAIRLEELKLIEV